MTDPRLISSLKIPIAIALVLLLLILFASLGVVGQSSGSWSQYANDSQHTGHSPNVEDVRQKPGVKWSHEGWVVDKPPVISDGRIYYWHRGLLGIVARNTTTGEKIWRRHIGSSATSPPAVTDGKVYIELSTNTSKLHAFDASTGNKVWSTSNHTGTPTVYNNKLYPTNPLAALNASTGNTLWTRNISTRISVVNQTVYAVNGTEYIHVIDASTGRTIKRHHVRHENASLFQVIAHGDTLYLAGRISDPDTLPSQTVTKIYALDRVDGYKKFRTTEASRIGAVTPGIVYVYSSSYSSVYALDAQSGNRLWSYNISGRVFGGIAVGNRTLYMNVGHMRGGEVHAVDAMTGERLWKIGQPADEGDNILATSPTPVPGDGVVYAGGVKTREDGGRNFYALSENGTPLSELNSDSMDGSAATSAVIGWILIFVLLGATIYVAYRRM